MTGELITKSETHKAVNQHKTPKESFEAEAVWKANEAWAKEQNDFEKVVTSFFGWILQRRRTTELIQPNISDGKFSEEYQPRGNNIVTPSLEDYGFTKMQWHRRTKELDVALEKINEYIDECIEMSVQPTLYGLLKVAHVSFSSGENEWYTPPKYIESAKKVMGEIDLDPASSEDANRHIGADEYYTQDNDGLNKQWKGKTWMNPPYSKELIPRFISKLTYHVKNGDIIESIVLVNNATDTTWFKELASVVSVVVFTEGRIKFLDDSMKPVNTPLQGQAICYIGDNKEKFIAEFAKYGTAFYK